MKQVIPPSHKKAFYLVLRLAKALRGFQGDATFCEDITYTQFAILDMVLEAGGRLRLTELHGLLNVEKSTTTRLIAPLLGKELLAKVRSSEDGRAYELVLTGEGRRVHATVWDCLSGHLDAMFRSMPGDELETIVTHLSLFGDALENCCKE